MNEFSSGPPIPPPSGDVCPVCHAPIQGNPRLCPNCGAVLAQFSSTTSRWGSLATAFFVLLATRNEMKSSTQLPSENAVCSHCGASLSDEEELSDWCPHCGAALTKVSIYGLFWRSLVTTAISCMLLIFGILGPCYLVTMGGIRLAQSRYAPWLLALIIVIFILARVLGVISSLRRKP